MDIGVGSFVVANALVSRQARNLPPAYVSLDLIALLHNVGLQSLRIVRVAAPSNLFFMDMKKQ